MDRLWDESLNVAAREAFGPVVPAFELLTHLGDGAVLIVLGVLIYWFGERSSRRERAFVIAIGTAALALSVGLKGLVQLARPELVFSPTGYAGYSFPSAHAMGAAGFYGALAVTMETGRAWQRYVAAGAVIAVVAASRVVMGVHFVGDVLVGTMLGLGLVWLGLRWRRAGEFAPGAIFVLAAAIAVFTILLGSRAFVSLVLGTSIGGAIGWWAVADRRTTDSGAAILALGSVAIVGLLAARVLSLSLADVVPVVAASPIVVIAEILAFAGLTALVLLIPALAVAIEDDPLVRRMQAILPFRGRRVELEPPVP